jgi:hypothetical protein
MVNKRGRKRKNEMYFGPDEETAVINFLEKRYLEVLNLSKNKSVTIYHNLGNDVIVSATHVIPNENAYGSDSKFIEVELDVKITNKTDSQLDISIDEDVNDVTIIIVNETERDLIFNEWLKAPLDKMVESIIRRYKLYRKGETFEDTHADTLSFLMTKVHKFEIGRKAYSYFGTIAKNYILGLRIKDEKYMKQNYSYEDMYEEFEERNDLVYYIDNDEFSMDKFLKKVSDGIKDELDDSNLPPKKKLNENERKVGYALVDILENWETAFESMDGGSKYNKNSVLETMRNYTNLSTKDIRLSMKRFKDMYEILKQRGL